MISELDETRDPGSPIYVEKIFQLQKCVLRYKY